MRGGFEEFCRALSKSVYGGSVANDSVAWYITCLIIVIILYKIIEKSKYKVWIVLGLYIIALIESYIIEITETEFACVWGSRYRFVCTNLLLDRR